jgi:glutaredoxin-like protein NrdH
MKVVIYGRDDNKCVQCRQTKRYLKNHKVEYEFHDVDSEAEAMAYVKSLGVLQVPVVVVGERHWSGFRPDLLVELVRIWRTRILV